MTNQPRNIAEVANGRSVNNHAEDEYQPVTLTRRGKVAATIVTAGLLYGALVAGQHNGSKGPIDTGPEERLSDQEIAQLHGGNTPEIAEQARQANLEEQQQAVSPTDIHPVSK